jgi:signal transduction histidine kinase
MFGKSLRYQLILLSLLFSIFGAVVLFQMYFTHRLQHEEITQLKLSHTIINSYLDLEDLERKILVGLRSYIDNEEKSKKTATVQKAHLENVEKQIEEWFEKLKSWKRFLTKWQKSSNVQIHNSVFNDVFVENKRRQAEAYARAARLCGEEGKIDDAKHILNIEASFLPEAHETIIAILEGIKLQIEADRRIVRNYYFSTAFAVLLALVALVFISFSIYRNISKKLFLLEDGARRISDGDFSREIDLSSPVEFSSLAGAFNEMQAAIKTRDKKIRDDSDEILKLNEDLEQKVIERNKTIIQQNIALKRKNEELEQILYAASHDLRTPLISIQGFSEELKLACQSLQDEVSKGASVSSEKLDEIVHGEIGLALNYIINGSKRMEMLLEALLRISRMGRESLQIKPTNMNDLLKNVKTNLEFQLNEADAELELVDLDDCSVDSSQFEQVFTNLISNAIKYREPSRKCHIKVYSEKDEDFTRYFVEDNGIGIPKEHMEKVFHAFYRVDEDFSEGDGVGLAIVNRALDLHNGRAMVESEAGKGSRFIVEMPNDNII